MHTELHEEKRDLLCREGMASYLNALVAIREFEQEILRRVQKIVKNKIALICKAMGVSENQELQDDVYNADSNYAQIMAKFYAKPVSFYFGVTFDRENSPNIAAVTVGVETNYVSQEVYLIEKCKQISADFLNYHPDKYIYLLDNLNPGEIELLQSKLETLIDRWIEAWKIVGGIKKLPVS